MALSYAALKAHIASVFNKFASTGQKITPADHQDTLEKLLDHITQDGAWELGSTEADILNPTVGKIPKRGASSLLDSLISESGGVVSVSGNFNVTGVINGIQMSKDMGNAFGATTYLKIAKLRESEDNGNYDNIIVDLVITRLWAADHLLISRYILGNRGSTSATNKYKWYITGGKGPLADNIVAGILCVKNTTTGEVDIYIKVSPTYNLVRFNVISANNITFYPDSATTTTVPSGTVEFDSTQFNTYPPMFYVDNSGNMKLRGTLTQSVTSW